jgi:predicted nucleic acid-binding protein
VEVAQALRRLVRAGEVVADRAEEALADLAEFDFRRHSHMHLLNRAWELRDNFTAYDAMYVALAEIDAPLVSCDGPLAATPGHAVRIEVIR